MTKKKIMGAVVVLASAFAILFVALRFNSRNELEEMKVPDDAMFIGAPSSGENQEFTITFSYDDSFAPTSEEGDRWQKIRWELNVFPKEGMEVSDFYCTLILDNWILERSSSPSLKYMGAGKGYVGNVPTDSKGLIAGMEKYVSVQTVDSPMYETAMTTPVKIMIAYDGQEKYYFVTPVRDNGDGT